MRWALTLGLVMFLGGSTLRAEINVKEYRELMASPDSAVTTKAYILGIGEGIAWANTELKPKPLFCAPQKLGLRIDNYIDIINDQIERMSKYTPKATLEDTMIGLVLLNGLRASFACAAK